MSGGGELIDHVPRPLRLGVAELERLAVEPRLAAWRDRLADATGQKPVLAGSGSTWWVPGAFPEVRDGVVTRTVCP